jgi:hypothetical protein
MPCPEQFQSPFMITGMETKSSSRLSFPVSMFSSKKFSHETYSYFARRFAA